VRWLTLFAAQPLTGAERRNRNGLPVPSLEAALFVDPDQRASSAKCFRNKTCAGEACAHRREVGFETRALGINGRGSGSPFSPMLVVARTLAG
jgi:hypothetical protein